MTCFLSAYNIRARHDFLAGLISTKTEEDLSLGNMNQLLAALTTCMLTFSALEAGFYFIYNKMVKIMMSLKYKKHFLFILHLIFN